jgi:hypothetical protein
VHPVIVFVGAVYLHAVFAVDAVDEVVYVPLDGLTPLNELHASHAVAVLLPPARYVPKAHAEQVADAVLLFAIT